ncbi:MAG: hypothetical protein HYR85_13050 [Planctomycetes bacterium]|nr:hypothetical protein [Planctomycetota bacterium]MBI3847904.1 hypothetical protein [Planctomycetota bacterium]
MKRFPKVLRPLFLLAICAAAVGAFEGDGEKMPKAVKAGEAMPSLEFVDLDGKPHTLAEFKGKTILVSLFFET